MMFFFWRCFFDVIDVFFLSPYHHVFLGFHLVHFDVYFTFILLCTSSIFLMYPSCFFGVYRVFLTCNRWFFPTIFWRSSHLFWREIRINVSVHIVFYYFTLPFVVFWRVHRVFPLSSRQFWLLPNVFWRVVRVSLACELAVCCFLFPCSSCFVAFLMIDNTVFLLSLILKVYKYVLQYFV